MLGAVGASCLALGVLLASSGAEPSLDLQNGAHERSAAHSTSRGTHERSAAHATSRGAHERSAAHATSHSAPHGAARGVPPSHRHHAGAVLKVLWLSDLHFNPFYTSLLGPSCKCMSYGPFACAEERDWALPWPFDGGACLAQSDGSPWGQFGCDAPFSLVESAIASARATCPEPAAILVTGDYVAHHSCQFPVTSPQDEAVRIVRETSAALARAFEHADVKHVHHPTQLLSAAVGNDDLVPNYALPNATDGHLAQPRAALVALADALTPPLDELQRHSFVRGGGVRYEIGKIVLLALNTVVYSPHAANPSGSLPADPFGQFAWLDAQLLDAHARRARVLIVGHIPPCVDQYSFQMEWLQPYADTYVTIVARHADVVSAQLFGHAHQNMLRAFPPVRGTAAEAGDGPPLHVSAAISPIYHNNPTYRLLSLSPSSGALHDFTVFAAQLHAASGSEPPEWAAAYSAHERYAPHDVLTSRGIRHFAVEMMTDDELFRAYLYDRESGAPGWDSTPGTPRFNVGRVGVELRVAARQPTPAGAYRAQMACSIAHGFSQAAFDACVHRGGPSAAADPPAE